MSTARSFLRGVIDYAGLFPPAKLDMTAAVNSYASYHGGADHDLLGRFVLPVSRLDEFAGAVRSLPEQPSSHWRLSCVATDPEDAAHRISDFNSASSQFALCDTVELAVKNSDEVNRAADVLPESIDVFLEPDILDDPLPLILEIATTRASAKIRTGGVVPSAIPSPEQVLRFIEACVDEGLPFKATAGLHHAIRGVYPLTYEPQSETATLFGFLNIFLGAALCAAGSSEGAVLGALEETNPMAFRFDDTGFWWEDHFVFLDQLSVVRQNVAVSFGSCSFTEPVTEAKALHII